MGNLLRKCSLTSDNAGTVTYKTSCFNKHALTVTLHLDNNTDPAALMESIKKSLAEVSPSPQPPPTRI